MNSVTITIKKNEEKIYPYIWINGEDEETTLTATLEEGASLTIAGLFFGTRNKKVTFHTTVIHASPRSKSLTLLRGVFLDTSSFINEGLVRINKGAKGSDGFFASKILLFDDARGKSIPSLEIDENDLKAGHASTVGRPDNEQLFYLRSRGLSEKAAQQLIISGFFEPVMRFLPEGTSESVKRQIGSLTQ